MIHGRKHTLPPAQRCRWLGSLQHLPPPSLRLPTTLSAHRSRVSPRLPHPLRICGGAATLTPCSILESGVRAGQSRASLPGTANQQPPPFPPSHPRSLLPSNPDLLHSLGWRLQPAVKFKAERGGSRWETPAARSAAGVGPAGHAALDLRPKAESGARRAQTLTVGRGDLNLHLSPLPSLTTAPFTLDSAAPGRRGATLPGNNITNC